MSATLLSFLLERLDRLHNPVLRFRELAPFPDEQRHKFEADGILRETTRAAHVPRPDNLPPGGELVVRATAKGLFGVADEDDYIDPVPLSDEDVRQYEISLPKLIECLRRDNGINGNGMTSIDGLIPLGQKAVDGAGTFDVFLSAPNQDEWQLLARCQRLERSPGCQKVVLLTPRGVALSAEGRQVVDRTGIVLASLAPAAERGELALNWCAIIGSTEPGLATSYSEDQHIFRRQGSTWLIVYAGKPTSVRHSVGVAHICYLLQNPGRHVHASVLRRETSQQRKPVSDGSAGELLDDESLRNYRDRLEDLQSEIEQAETNHDVGRVERLREEFAMIVAELQRGTGLGGRKRKASDDRERARQAVSAAIRRALKAIERQHEPLWQHLANSLKIGEVLCYQPEKPINWLT